MFIVILRISLSRVIGDGNFTVDDRNRTAWIPDRKKIKVFIINFCFRKKERVAVRLNVFLNIQVLR